MFWADESKKEVHYEINQLSKRIEKKVQSFDKNITESDERIHGLSLDIETMRDTFDLMMAKSSLGGGSSNLSRPEGAQPAGTSFLKMKIEMQKLDANLLEAMGKLEENFNTNLTEIKEKLTAIESRPVAAYRSRKSSIVASELSSVKEASSSKDSTSQDD